MDSSTSIQLQFRSGDDLFNNYGISIIRQVVDKSEYKMDCDVFTSLEVLYNKNERK